MNKHEILTCIEVEPRQAVKHSIIWLHGLGADGNDFVPIAAELDASADSDMRFIFPNAPVIPITLNNGYEMRAWFDISGLSLDAEIDKPGIAESTIHIERLIEREVNRGISTDRIFLAGFSQGAVMAMVTGICYPKPLAGIIALSGFLPETAELSEKASPANQHIPIFLAHGRDDPIVPYALGLFTQSHLTKAGYTVDWHSYDMPHTVCPEEVLDLKNWLNKYKRKTD